MFYKFKTDLRRCRLHCRFNSILQYICHQRCDIKHLKTCFPGQSSRYGEIYLLLLGQIQIIIHNNIKKTIACVDLQIKFILYIPDRIYIRPDLLDPVLICQFSENADMIYQIMLKTPYSHRLLQLIIVLLLLHTHKSLQFPVLSV